MEVTIEVISSPAVEEADEEADEVTEDNYKKTHYAYWSLFYKQMLILI